MTLDIRIVRLSVVMTRDDNLRRFLAGNRIIRDVLLYVGVPVENANETASGMDFRDPTQLAPLLQVLYEQNMLAPFLTQLVQMDSPQHETVFDEHLEPLGLSYDGDQVLQLGTHSQAEQELQSELKQLLGKVDKRFPDMLEGAWEAFYSENKDKYRQALVSCRELLDDVLEILGDGKKLKNEKKERKRKIWVREILGSGRESEIVMTSTNLISSLYGMESSIHGEPDRSTALFALTETEHILYFLLTHRHDKRKKRTRGV